MKKFNPKINNAMSYQYWSWLESSITNQYQLVVKRKQPQQVTFDQHQPMLKWAKRSIKKKRGHIQIQSKLHHNQYRKPLGVRMGSGKGKINQKYLLSRCGSVILVYKNIQPRMAMIVKKFFKKSNLQLSIINKKC